LPGRNRNTGNAGTPWFQRFQLFFLMRAKKAQKMDFVPPGQYLQQMKRTLTISVHRRIGNDRGKEKYFHERYYNSSWKKLLEWCDFVFFHSTTHQAGELGLSRAEMARVLPCFESLWGLNLTILADPPRPPSFAWRDGRDLAIFRFAKNGGEAGIRPLPAPSLGKPYAKAALPGFHQPRAETPGPSTNFFCPCLMGDITEIQLLIKIYRKRAMGWQIFLGESNDIVQFPQKPSNKNKFAYH
jgi:hypothetical protein